MKAAPQTRLHVQQAAQRVVLRQLPRVYGAILAALKQTRFPDLSMLSAFCRNSSRQKVFSSENFLHQRTMGSESKIWIWFCIPDRRPPARSPAAPAAPADRELRRRQRRGGPGAQRVRALGHAARRRRQPCGRANHVLLDSVRYEADLFGTQLQGN